MGDKIMLLFGACQDPGLWARGLGWHTNPGLQNDFIRLNLEPRRCFFFFLFTVKSPDHYLVLTEP